MTAPQEEAAVDDRSAWDEVRRLADEIELKVHLARMDVRQRWRELEPRLSRLDAAITRTSEQINKAIAQEVAALRALLFRLRSDVNEN
jgi:hypothetical protein